MTLPTEGQSGHLQKHADIDTLIAGHTSQIAAGDVTNPASAAGIAVAATIGAAVAPKLDDATAATTYRKLGSDATARLMALLKNETQDASILVVGDSTGVTTDRWIYRLAGLLGADWPRWTVLHAFWNDATPGYDAPTTIQTGTVARTLTIWNASVTGFMTTSWQGAKAATALYALNPDLVIMSLGHNEQAVAADLWHSRYLGLSESIASGLPGADIMLIAQNPATANTLQQQRVEVYRQIAARRGYGFVDVQQAFLDTGDAPGLTVDGIHPTTAGSILWAATVKSAFVYQAGGRRTTQTPSTLVQAGDNLLLNGDFTAFASAVPDNWVLTSGTAARDTVNFESHTLNRTTASYVAADALAVKFTASAVSTNLKQYVPIKKCQGKWVTLAVRVFVPVGQPGTVGRIGISDSTGSTLHIANAAGNGAFSWVIVSRFIALTASTCNALVYVDSGTTAGNLTIDRVIMCLGKFPFGK